VCDLKEDIRLKLQRLRRDLTAGSEYDHLAQFARIDENLVEMKSDLDEEKTVVVQSEELTFLLYEHLQLLKSFFTSAYPETMHHSNQQTYFPKEHFFFTPDDDAYPNVNGRIHALPIKSFDAFGYEDMWRKLVNNYAEVRSMVHEYEELLCEQKVLKAVWKTAWDKEFSPAAMSRRFA
jgi:hypothetical protein